MFAIMDNQTAQNGGQLSMSDCHSTGWLSHEHMTFKAECERGAEWRKKVHLNESVDILAFTADSPHYFDMMFNLKCSPFLFTLVIHSVRTLFNVIVFLYNHIEQKFFIK